MTKLKQLEDAMKAQFIWDKTGVKKLQVDEEFEGAKDLARMIFVGIADMYGFEARKVMDYLDMEYESHRHKLSHFKSYYKEAKKRVSDGSLSLTEDAVKKVYIKSSLCLNSISFRYNTDPYITLENWINHD
jgi:hypothetical protein